MESKRWTEKFYSKLVKEEADGEIKYYKKIRVYPWINEEGKINWANFLFGGSIKKWIFPLMILGLITLAIIEYYSNIKACGVAVEYYNQMHNLTKIPVNLSNIIYTP